MVKKQKVGNDKKKSDAQLSSTVKESAQQIWLAGLGAFSKAQEEGGKVFEALVKEGLSLQRKTQTVAEEKITEATSRMTTMATDIGSRAAGQWDKLENIFEERVAKALGKLGVPSARDIEALHARIEALTPKATKASAAKTTAKTAARSAARPEAKAPAKTAVRKPTSAGPAVKSAATKRAAPKRRAPAAPRASAPSDTTSAP